MNAFMVTARRALATLGWLGILGVVLLVSTVVMYATVVLALLTKCPAVLVLVLKFATPL